MDKIENKGIIFFVENILNGNTPIPQGMSSLKPMALGSGVKSIYG